MSRNLGIIVAALCVALSLVSAAHAATAIYDAVTATPNASTLYGSGNQVIDGSGLFFAVPSVINSIADLPNHDEDGPVTMWVTGGSTATIVFDFGTRRTINTIFVWNYGEEAHAKPTDGGVFNLTARGVNGVDVYYSLSTILNPADPVGSGATLAETTTFNQATNATLTSTNVDTNSGLDWNKDFNIIPVAYTLPTYITAQYVEFNITSDFPGFGTGFVGLSEVRFGAAPEPASLGLLVAGGATLLGRRRRRAA